MPRKGPAPKRPLDVDPVYGSPVVTQLADLAGVSAVHLAELLAAPTGPPRAPSGAF